MKVKLEAGVTNIPEKLRIEVDSREVWQTSFYDGMSLVVAGLGYATQESLTSWLDIHFPGERINGATPQAVELVESLVDSYRERVCPGCPVRKQCTQMRMAKIGSSDWPMGKISFNNDAEREQRERRARCTTPAQNMDTLMSKMFSNYG